MPRKPHRLAKLGGRRGTGEKCEAGARRGEVPPGGMGCGGRTGRVGRTGWTEVGGQRADGGLIRGATGGSSARVRLARADEPPVAPEHLSLLLSLPARRGGDQIPGVPASATTVVGATGAGAGAAGLRSLSRTFFSPAFRISMIAVGPASPSRR